MKNPYVMFAAAVSMVVGAHVPGDVTVYEAQTVEPVVVEEKIEEIEWTPERVEQEVRKVFHDAPIMVAVAKCESEFRADVCNPTSPDCGVFQVNWPAHGARLTELGLDRLQVEDNLKYARMLYDESGLAPWGASRSCWSK